MDYFLITLAIVIVLFVAHSGYKGVKYGAAYLPKTIMEISNIFSEHRAILDGITYFSFDCTRLLTVEYVTDDIMNLYIRDMSKEIRGYVLKGIDGIEVDINSDVRCRISHESYLKIIERLCEYYKDTKYPLRIKYLSPLMPE
ncbi:MAG: hypothetical protein P1V21_24435 [Rhizobiaceae bacterium]|nr:hypothetical protein [Rhizobiaceae bacterium]